MVKVKLPAVEKTIDETGGRLVTREKEIEVTVDTSVFSEERWEICFPNNAKRETLFAYVERVRQAGLLDSHTQILSNLKALFCFLEGADIPDFKSFCRLFDLADAERCETLVSKIKQVFELVLGSSAVDEKNS